jgi:hypothetical protein
LSDTDMISPSRCAAVLPMKATGLPTVNRRQQIR